MLSKKNENQLNAGTALTTELDSDSDGNRTFVVVTPIDKPNVPRDGVGVRYLNSKYNIWEYWDFEFRKITLKPDWESYQADYDLYILKEEIKVSVSDNEFFDLAKEWVEDLSQLLPLYKSECPC